MDDDQFRELIRRSRRNLRSGLRCPDDNRLAAYVTGQLDEDGRKTLESHASDCASCLSTLAFLTQSAEWTALEGAPVSALRRAKTLVTRNPNGLWSWRWAFATATAACLLLAVAWLAFRLRSEQLPTASNGELIAQQQPTQIPTVVTPPAIEPQRGPTVIQNPRRQEVPRPQVRGEADALRPALLFPKEGAVIKHDNVRLSWKPVPGAIDYGVKLVTDDGGFVSSSRTRDATATLERDNLKPGAKYFVTIVAYLSDGQTIESRLVSFRVARE